MQSDVAPKPVGRFGKSRMECRDGAPGGGVGVGSAARASGGRNARPGLFARPGGRACLTGTRAELTALALCPTGEKMLAKALQAADPKLAFERERLVLASTADGKGGATNPGVRHWLRYCIWGRHVNPVRSADETAPRAERLADEDLLMDFALWLVYCKPTGRNISPKTARKYVSQVQGWLAQL